MQACFAVLGSIAFTTRKFVNNVRAEAIGYFVFVLEKMEIGIDDLKVTLIFTKGKVSTDAIF